jgi:hypothetical protein
MRIGFAGYTLLLVPLLLNAAKLDQNQVPTPTQGPGRAPRLPVASSGDGSCDEGADVNSRDKTEGLPLMLAAERAQTGRLR